MTDAEREINRLISYIRSCREANIDCTVTIGGRVPGSQREADAK